MIRASETQITADQASRLLGIETSSLAELRLIRAALIATTVGIPVPSLAAGFASPKIGGVELDVVNEFHFHGPVTDGRALGTQAGSALVDVLDRELGRRLLVQQRHVGKAVSS